MITLKRFFLKILLWCLLTSMKFVHFLQKRDAKLKSNYQLSPTTTPMMTGLTNKEDDGNGLVLLTVGVPEKELPNLIAALELTGLHVTLPESVKALASFWSNEDSHF